MEGTAALYQSAAPPTSGVIRDREALGLDELLHQQARELNPKHREELLYERQRLVHERVMFVPIYESAGRTGIDPRAAEPGLGLISTYQWSVPYEEVGLKP